MFDYVSAYICITTIQQWNNVLKKYSLPKFLFIYGKNSVIKNGVVPRYSLFVLCLLLLLSLFTH